MPWLIAAIVVIAVAGIAINVIVESLKGASIILLGPTVSGKTTFLKFLKSGKISEIYEPTEFTYKESGKSLNLGDLDLKINSITDNPGAYYTETNTEPVYNILEKKIFDYIFYFFDAEKVYHQDKQVMQNIREDTRMIVKRLNKNQPKIGFIFIGTHEDKLFNSIDIKQRSEYAQKIIKNEVFSHLLSQLNEKNIKSKFLIGSLLNKENRIKEFTKRILEACVEIKKQGG